jgi:hypothetical protein
MRNNNYESTKVRKHEPKPNSLMGAAPKNRVPFRRQFLFYLDAFHTNWENRFVAKQASGEVNKSAAIREIYEQYPKMKVKQIVSTLAEHGISVAPNLVYMVKGKMKGEKTHRRKVNRIAARAATSAGNMDALATIIKVKALAAEVGGFDALKALVDALSA